MNPPQRKLRARRAIPRRDKSDVLGWEEGLYRGMLTFLLFRQEWNSIQEHKRKVVQAKT